MFTISKRFEFSASHQLNGLPADHPCSRLHGHNYAVEIELEGTLDVVGFVVDYRELDVVKRWIDDTLDHRHLNDVVAFNPTAELLAHHVWTLCVSDLLLLIEGSNWRVAAVRVFETPKTCAEYRPT